jgi:ABC-2 type transport system permease protein
MRALVIMRKDLVQIFRDRRALVFLLLMPLAFTFFFGLAFSGMGGASDDRLQLGVVDDDASVLSQRLVAWLGDSGSARPEPLDELRARYAGDLVRRGDYAAVLSIPSGWGAAVAGGEPASVEVIADSGSSAGMAAARAVDGVVQRFLTSERAARTAADLLAPGSDAPPANLRAEAMDRALAAWADPPLAVSARVAGPRPAAPGGEAGPGGIVEGGIGDNPYNQASPGMIVQFAVYGLLLSAMVLVIERNSGTYARVLSTPTPRAAVLAGHGLAMGALVLAQVVVLEAFGQFAFGVDYLRSPLATLALTLAVALWSASLGMLIGAFARSEQQVVAIALVAMFVFSGLGGAWFPLEVTGPTFTAIGHLTPTAWAMDAYRAIVLRGDGLAAVAPALLILVAYAVAFFVLALVRMARSRA